MKPQTWQWVERLILDNGGKLLRSSGSHFQWKMPNGATVTVPHHPKVLPIGTMLSIIRTAGLRGTAKA